MASAGSVFTCKRIQAAPSSNLELSGVVSASGFVNLLGGANIVNPDFSGTITGLSKANVGLANVDNTSDASKPASTAVLAALALKANALNPTFTGDTSVANLTVNGNISMASAGSVFTCKRIQAAPSSNLELSGIVSASGFVNLTGGANIVNPDFSGTITGLTKSTVGLANVDNTSDAAKPLSTAATTALAGKAPVFDLGTGLQWGNILGPGNLILNANGSLPVPDAAIAALFLKADKANPTFTGSVTTPDLTVNGNISMTQSGSVFTCKRIQAAPSSNLEVAGIVVASGDVSITGNLSVTTFFNARSYVAGYVYSGALNQSSGFVLPTLTRTNRANGVYTFTFSPAHPNGTNYCVSAFARTGATAGQTFTAMTVNIVNSTTFNVWARDAAFAAKDADFYLSTVP